MDGRKKQPKRRRRRRSNVGRRPSIAKTVHIFQRSRMHDPPNSIGRGDGARVPRRERVMPPLQ